MVALVDGKLTVRGLCLFASLALFLIVVICGTGCNHATTHVHMVSLEQADVLNACDVVVEGHVTQAYSRSNLTFAEDVLSPGEPTDPKHGSMTVFTMKVEKKIKGGCVPAELALKANDPESVTKEEGRFRGMLKGVVTGSWLRVGWKEVLGVRSDMKIVVLSVPQRN